MRIKAQLLKMKVIVAMMIKDNSNMNSDHFQITYYKLTHGKHKTSLQIMMANSIYGKTSSKGIITDLNTARVTISYIELKKQRDYCLNIRCCATDSTKHPYRVVSLKVGQWRQWAQRITKKLRSQIGFQSKC